MQFTLMPACHVMATLGRPLHETRDDSSRDETHPSMKFTACLHARRRRVHSYLHSYLTSSLSNWRYLIGQKFGGQNCRKFGLAPKVLSAEKFCPPKILSAEIFVRRIFVRRIFVQKLITIIHVFMLLPKIDMRNLRMLYFGMQSLPSLNSKAS